MGDTADIGAQVTKMRHDGPKARHTAAQPRQGRVRRLTAHPLLFILTVPSAQIFVRASTSMCVLAPLYTSRHRPHHCICLQEPRRNSLLTSPPYGPYPSSSQNRTIADCTSGNSFIVTRAIIGRTPHGKGRQISYYLMR